MGPNSKVGSLEPNQKTPENTVNSSGEDIPGEGAGDQKILWQVVFAYGYIQLAGLYGSYLVLSGQAYWWTVGVNLIVHQMASFGVTAGAHRLWSHRSYKAKLPLQILLCIFQAITYQNSIYQWARNHRLHHRYSDTDADPHNASRGFFFSHVGWFLRRKHIQVKLKGKSTYLADLEENPVVMFQDRYFFPLAILFCILIPWYIPVHFGEDYWVSWHVTFARYMVNLHLTFCINSFAHLCGNKPYDKSIYPGQNKILSIFTCGESWHNYHHTFPWDYRSAELTAYKYNTTAAFIDFMAWIGWAYDLKTVSDETVMQRVNRTGDGSHPRHGGKNSCDGNMNSMTPGVWGWGDKEMTKEDEEVTLILNKMT